MQGFDRLRDANFTEEDIEALRAEFRASRSNGVGAHDDEDEHERAMEDQWMEGLSGQGDTTDQSAFICVVAFQ